MRQWETAWLTGATGGLGRVLARQLAREGRVKRLVLLARHVDEAEREAKDIQLRYGMTTQAIPFDAVSLTERRVRRMLRETSMPSLVILTHGIMPPEDDFLNPRLAEEECRVNLLSNLIFLHTLLKEGFQGDVVLVTSVAALRAKKRNALYGMSKAALLHAAEALRQYGREQGIHVLDVRPGILQTRMSAHVPFPFKEAPEHAARHILRALDTRKQVIYTPGWWYYAMLLLRSLPASVYDRLKL